MSNIVYKSKFTDKNIQQVKYQNLSIKQIVYHTDTTLKIFYHDVFTTIFRQIGIGYVPYFYADGTIVKEFTYAQPWVYTDPNVLAIRLDRRSVNNDNITHTITFGKYSLKYVSVDNHITFVLWDNTKSDNGSTGVLWQQSLGIALTTDPIALYDQFVIKCYKSSLGFLDKLCIQFYNQNGAESTLKYTIVCPLTLTELFGKTLEGAASGTYISAFI